MIELIEKENIFEHIVTIRYDGQTITVCVDDVALDANDEDILDDALNKIKEGCTYDIAAGHITTGMKVDETWDEWRDKTSWIHENTAFKTWGNF